MPFPPHEQQWGLRAKTAAVAGKAKPIPFGGQSFEKKVAVKSNGT